MVVSTVDAAARHVAEYLSSTKRNVAEERTVLLASADSDWRSEVEARLRERHVRPDTVGSFAEHGTDSWPHPPSDPYFTNSPSFRTRNRGLLANACCSQPRCPCP